MNDIARGILYAALIFSVLACGTLQISVVGTETPDTAVAGTVAALQTQNAELVTKVAQATQVVVVTPIPATVAPGRPTPTPQPPPATRLTFLNGATVGVVSAPIGAGQIQTYIVDVFQAQPMFVYVASASSDVTVSIQDENGATILSPGARKISWQGSLTKTGDYYLTVHGGASNENFTMTVTIPSRIQFGQGKDSATVSGKTVAGYNVGYTLHAAKGQTMSVNLENLSSKASLSIIGFTDGQHYLQPDAGQKSYQFMLPSTQDYIITVVPMNGLVVDYTLTITIQ